MAFYYSLVILLAAQAFGNIDIKEFFYLAINIVISTDILVFMTMYAFG